MIKYFVKHLQEHWQRLILNNTNMINNYKLSDADERQKKQVSSEDTIIILLFYENRFLPLHLYLQFIQDINKNHDLQSSLKFHLILHCSSYLFQIYILLYIYIFRYISFPSLQLEKTFIWSCLGDFNIEYIHNYQCLTFEHIKWKW